MKALKINIFTSFASFQLLQPRESSIVVFMPCWLSSSSSMSWMEVFHPWVTITWPCSDGKGWFQILPAMQSTLFCGLEINIQAALSREPLLGINLGISSIEANSFSVSWLGKAPEPLNSIEVRSVRKVKEQLNVASLRCLFNPRGFVDLGVI